MLASLADTELASALARKEMADIEAAIALSLQIEQERLEQAMEVKLQEELAKAQKEAEEKAKQEEEEEEERKKKEEEEERKIKEMSEAEAAAKAKAEVIDVIDLTVNYHLSFSHGTCISWLFFRRRLLSLRSQVCVSSFLSFLPFCFVLFVSSSSHPKIRCSLFFVFCFCSPCAWYFVFFSHVLTFFFLPVHSSGIGAWLKIIVIFIFFTFG